MFILIHGAQHSSRCWEPIVDRLNAPALAIDMPGRGGHPAPLDKLHVNDFIDSAVQDIEDSEANDAILVGHSMAGLSIPGIVERVHERLRHIVFVSCAVPPQGESLVSLFPPELAELADLAVPEPAGVFPGRKVIVQMQCYDMDEHQTAFTAEVCVPEAYWPMRDPVDLVGLRHPVPRTWVKLMGDRSFPPEQQDVMAERAECTDVVELDAGHMAMISQPNHLADALNKIHSR